jgi:hypothetical protein
MSTNVIDKPRPRIEEERARRRRREDITTGRLRNLAVEGDMDPRYEYRWINDDPGRVHRLTVRDDWETVTSDQLGIRHDKDKGVGSGVERVVGKSDGKRGILVRKPKDYYIGDKLKEQSMLDETDAAMKRGETSSPDGLREIEGGKGYVPSGGIIIQDGRRG